MKRPADIFGQTNGMRRSRSRKKTERESRHDVDGDHIHERRVADDGYAYTREDFEKFYPEWAAWNWARAVQSILTPAPPEGLVSAQVDECSIREALAEILPHLVRGEGEFEVGWSYRKGEYVADDTWRTNTVEAVPLESVPCLRKLMLQSMKQLCPEKEFGVRLNVICRIYTPPHGIAMHTDKRDWFDNDVFGVILENTSDRALQLHKSVASKSELTQCYFLQERPGACFWMSGPARWNWKHGVAPLTQGRRISVTWRWFLPGIRLRSQA